MLPVHLQVSSRKEIDDSDSDDSRRQNRRLESREHPNRQPPLGLTGVLCESKSLYISGRGNLRYTIFRPRNMQQGMLPPLICIAGGPLLPCTYLSPIVHLITDRSILFYDPIGVGQSKPLGGSTKTTDIDLMVKDFASLVSALPIPQFHLFGHSFGGVLAYEYLRGIEATTTNHNEKSCECLSVVLSNVPPSVQASTAVCETLLEEICQEMNASDLDQQLVQETFSSRHECRVRPIPLPLQQSYEMAGFYSSSKGLETVSDYSAEKEITRDISALVLRGQYDFVTDTATWESIFAKSCVITLAGCAHFPMLENEDAFGGALKLFLTEHDPVKDAFITLPNGVRVRR